MSAMTLDRLAELMELRFRELEAKIESTAEALEAKLEEKLESKLEEKLDAKLGASIGALRTEMLERLQSMNDRLDTLELRSQQLNTSVEEVRGQLVNVRSEVERLAQRIYFSEDAIYHLSTRVDSLGDDMGQRFRTLTERLSAA